MDSSPNWKSRLQSQTLRAALIAAVISLLRILTVVFGWNLDLEPIEFWMGVGLYVLAEGFNLGLLRIIWSGRVRADTIIKPLPWKDEIKSIIKKGDKV